MATAPNSDHYRAAEAFAQRVREQYDESVVDILLYGSVARGDERGDQSDVDLIVVLRDTVDKNKYERHLRDLAYEIELDRGIILSLIVLSASEFRQSSNPFLQNVQREAEPLYG